MWTWADTISVAFGVLGIAGGIAGWVRGGRAAKKAAEATKRAEEAARAANQAREDAAIALARSASANEESAEALKRANVLTEQLAAPPPAPWAIEKTVNGWTLINKTGHVVPWVFIQSLDERFHEPPSTWDNIDPNGQIVLQAVQSFTKATVTVIWLPPGSETRKTYAITVDGP